MQTETNQFHAFPQKSIPPLKTIPETQKAKINKKDIYPTLYLSIPVHEPGQVLM